MTEVNMIYYYENDDKEIDGIVWKLCASDIDDFKKENIWWEQWPSEWIVNTRALSKYVHPNLISIFCLKYEIF